MSEKAPLFKERGRTILKVVVFLLLLSLAVSRIQDVLGICKKTTYYAVEGLYEEKPGSLDALFVGASNVHAFWQPTVGFDRYGMAVWSYSVDSMPGIAIKNMIIEARKTQPDALYIINLNCYKEAEVSDVKLHRIVDYMHPSLNKAELINTMADAADIPLSKRLEFFFPLMRFHSRWSETIDWDFYHTLNGMKTSLIYDPYFKNIEDISDSYIISDSTDAPRDAKELQELDDLLAFLDAEQIKALFVVVPQAMDESDTAIMNYMAEQVEQRGYPCVNTQKNIEELHISTETDFYNLKHTNVHGSLKFTGYLADYLHEHYDFADKRGQAGWEEWDQAVEMYNARLVQYALPFEMEFASRDYSLEAPAIHGKAVSDTSYEVNWDAVEGAVGYAIYRKVSGGKPNELLATVEADALSFTDTDLAADKAYKYTVVPFRSADGQTSYGNFSYTGVTRLKLDQG